MNSEDVRLLVVLLVVFLVIPIAGLVWAEFGRRRKAPGSRTADDSERGGRDMIERSRGDG